MSFPLLAFIGFAVAASITPGPNNVMVAASATRNGLRATLPHIAGINVGFTLMIASVGLGLAAPLAQAPAVQAAGKWIGAAWLLYLAWQVATASPPDTAAPRPLLGFRGAALFQWINPKAWLIALAVATTWIAPDMAVWPQVALMAAVFLVVGIPSNLIWAGIGLGAAGLLRSPGRLRAFNVAMALLLVASLVPMLAG